MQEEEEEEEEERFCFVLELLFLDFAVKIHTFKKNLLLFLLIFYFRPYLESRNWKKSEDNTI